MHIVLDGLGGEDSIAALCRRKALLKGLCPSVNDLRQIGSGRIGVSGPTVELIEVLAADVAIGEKQIRRASSAPDSLVTLIMSI